MKEVCLVIVTYDRADYLCKLLNSIQKQTYPVKEIVLVDNHSKDHTFDMILDMGFTDKKESDQIVKHYWGDIQTYYYYNSVNSGGAGGFALGIKIAKTIPCDFIWVMDDDVLPDCRCLEKLCSNLNEHCYMCIPNRGDERYDDFAIGKINMTNPFLFRLNSCKQHIINSKNIIENVVYVEDMAFEGPIFKKQLLDLIDGPDSNYFILYDDTDFAYRASRITKIGFVKDAILHKQIIPNPQDFPWTWKSYYAIRNSVYFDRKFGKNIGVKVIRPLLRIIDMIIRSILKLKIHRIKWIVKAYCDAIANNMKKTVEPDKIVPETKKRNI